MHHLNSVDRREAGLVNSDNTCTAKARLTSNSYPSQGSSTNCRHSTSRCFQSALRFKNKLFWDFVAWTPLCPRVAQLSLSYCFKHPVGPVTHLPALCRSLSSHGAFKIIWLARLKQLNPIYLSLSVQLFQPAVVHTADSIFVIFFLSD